MMNELKEKFAVIDTILMAVFFVWFVSVMVSTLS